MLLDKKQWTFKTPSWPMAMNCGCKCHQHPIWLQIINASTRFRKHCWTLVCDMHGDYVSLYLYPKKFAVVNYTTYYLQTSSVHHQCTGDSLFNYPYTLLIIKSLHYAMVSGYHTRNENKSYYHSSHKSKSVSWNKIKFNLLHQNLVQSGVIRTSSFRLASLHQTSLGIKILNVSPCQPPQKKLDQIQGWW